MNVHEVIDRFGTQSPRIKTGAFIAVFVVIVAILGGVFYMGTRVGDGWAESKYLKKRAENEIKIAKYEAEQQRLAGVNNILKKQNEDLAAERDKADKRLIAQNAEKDRQRASELQSTIARIDAQSTAPAIICATCEAQRKAGNELSAELCGQCYKQP